MLLVQLSLLTMNLVFVNILTKHIFICILIILSITSALRVQQENSLEVLSQIKLVLQILYLRIKILNSTYKQDTTMQQL